MSRMNNVNLEDNPKYYRLKSMVYDYYQDPMKIKDLKSSESMLYQGLAKMLIQLASTKDKGL